MGDLSKNEFQRHGRGKGQQRIDDDEKAFLLVWHGPEDQQPNCHAEHLMDPTIDEGRSNVKNRRTKQRVRRKKNRQKQRQKQKK